MNNARMWLVVSPTVGLPIFLGGVAVGSFCVHVAVLSNTDWVSDFLNGDPIRTASVEGTVQTAELAGGPVELTDGETMTIVLPDGTLADAVLQKPPLEVAESRFVDRYLTD